MNQTQIQQQYIRIKILRDIGTFMTIRKDEAVSITLLKGARVSLYWKLAKILIQKGYAKELLLKNGI